MSRLTVCRRDEEIVSECRRAANQKRLREIQVFIVEVQVHLQMLVCQKVACMSRDASAGHDLRTLPEAKETLILVQNAGYAPHP